MSLFDHIFVRVGSSDDIQHDKSSFFMEMAGVAAIMERDPSASMLVCLDELGRSTAPDDGAAIFTALIRSLARRERVLSLLSTHFAISESQLPESTNIVHLEVITQADSHVFTHRLRPGIAASSLAFHVARIAGVPEDLIRDAERIKNNKD